MSVKYPHMMPEDEPVWDRWLTRYHVDGQLYAYDVKVGESITTPQDIPEPYAGMAYMLSKKRIDVIITFSDRVVVAEVKRLAGWTAIGQLLGYPLLFTNEYDVDLPVSGLLICEALTLDTQSIMDYFKLPYIIV
jgi:hypothetical protein